MNMNDVDFIKENMSGDELLNELKLLEQQFWDLTALVTEQSHEELEKQNELRDWDSMVQSKYNTMTVTSNHVNNMEVIESEQRTAMREIAKVGMLKRATHDENFQERFQKTSEYQNVNSTDLTQDLQKINEEIDKLEALKKQVQSKLKRKMKIFKTLPDYPIDLSGIAEVLETIEGSDKAFEDNQKKKEEIETNIKYLEKKISNLDK